MLSRAVVLVAFACLLLVPSAFAEPDMQEGEWEISVKMEMPGMPFALPPIKHRTCITKENLVPQPVEKNQECTMTEMTSKGNVVAWVMDCKTEEGTMHSEGKITYQGDSFAGAIASTMRSADGEAPMNQQISGRRLGPCK
ncbi:MAG: DUF3617 family protein [Desulfuromonadales bacterium]